jgi:hypothetical protein
VKEGRPVESLVLIHLSSLDSYADLEYEATGDRDGSYELAYRMADAVLKHQGPVFIVDQGWYGLGRESRPRWRFLDQIGVDEENGMSYQQWQEGVEELQTYQQRDPKRDITWIKFDEQYTSWDEFLPLLEGLLKKAGTDKVTLGGLFFEPDLSEGCVTHTYQFLQKLFPTTVPLDLVGCASDFYGPEEDLPGGYTHGERPKMGGPNVPPLPGQPAPGPWNEYLMPLEDPYTDWVREILRIRLANSVNWLGLPVEEAVDLAKCLGEATSIENINAIIQRHLPTTLNDAFINEVGRLFRYWHGSAIYAARPELYEQEFVRARSWYLYLTAAAVVEDECGLYKKTRTYRSHPSTILMDAAWKAGEGLPVPEIN